ncbi:MAG: gluconokinase, partial [Paralcaligenes sp.]
VDIGTTSTKALVFEENGRTVASHHVEYPLLAPQPLAAEQDPKQIYNAVIACIKTVIESSGISAARVECVSFSSAMHSLIAVDKDNRLLTQCITWADNRSGPWAQRIKRELGGHAIYLRTGTPIHPMAPLSKLCWLRDTQPDLFAKAARFISIKEYVFYHLFGCYVVDYSIASATGLFNLAELAWDTEAIKLAGIRTDQLSLPVATTHTLKGLNPDAARATGLRPNTPFVIGASDGVLSNLGVNAIGRGVVAVTIGTSGAVRTVVDRPQTDPKGRTFCYALTDKHWVIGGPVNNGGIVLRWVHENFATEGGVQASQPERDPYDSLIELAAQIPAGSDGLIFNPYLTGERAPLWNANARGSFFGLAMHHRKEHMIRAALEGVIYNLYGVLSALESLAGAARKIHATGGFARSELWCQMMADVFNRDIDVPLSHESSCLGAAVLGLYALGRIDSLGAVSAMVGTTAHYVPNSKNAAVYSQLLPIFASIPVKLQEEYESIAKLQQ